MFLDKRNCTGSAGIRTPIRPARTLAATRLSQLAVASNPMKVSAPNGTVSSVDHVILTSQSSREQRYCIDIL